MAQDQLWKPQPTRRSGGRAFAYRGSHLPHAEPQFTRLSRSRHPLTPKSAISPFAADNSPDYLNYYIFLLRNPKARRRVDAKLNRNYLQNKANLTYQY